MFFPLTALIMLDDECRLALQRVRNHGYFPSFPTRRSSDLPRPAGDGPRLRLGPRGRPAGRAPVDRRFPGSPDARVRSEEHTSELQSLTNIVCRLLLEKKTRERRGKPKDTSCQKSRNHKE